MQDTIETIIERNKALLNQLAEQLIQDIKQGKKGAECSTRRQIAIIESEIAELREFEE